MRKLRTVAIAAALGAGLVMTPVAFAQSPARSTTPKDPSDPRSPGALVMPGTDHGSDAKKKKKDMQKDLRSKDSPAGDAKLRSGVSGPKGARDADSPMEDPAPTQPPRGQRE